MFILPANNRPSSLTAALQGLSQSSRIIHEGAKEKKQALQKSRISNLLSNSPEALQHPQNIIQAVQSGVIPEKVGIALLNHLATSQLEQQKENAPYIRSGANAGASYNPMQSVSRSVSRSASQRVSPSVSRGASQRGTEQYDTSHAYSHRPSSDSYNQTGNDSQGLSNNQKANDVSVQMPTQGLPGDDAPAALAPQAPAPLPHPLTYQEAPSADDLRASGATKKEYELSETQRKENNERYQHYAKENAPIKQQSAASIKTGEKLLSAGLRLKELNKKDGLKGGWNVPLEALAKATGMDPIVFLSGNEEMFNKEVANLLPVYLRNSYTGRILLAEVEEQRKGIVSTKNSPEARSKLIDGIINLGRASIESGKDYARVAKEHGPADPMLEEHLLELAEKRFMKENGGKKLMVKGVDGHMYEIPYRDVQAFEESQQQMQIQ